MINRSKSHQPNRGSVVIAVLLLALVIISTVTIYLKTAVQEMKFSQRTFALQQALNLSEMGAEEAIWALNNDDWTQWTELATDRYYRTIYKGDSTIYTYVDKQLNSNIWLASGSDVPVINDSVQKQLFIRLGYRSMFANGLTAKNKIVMNGNKINIDSYNSDLGSYHTTDNRNDNGSIASVSVEVDSVNTQNADILGFVATGGSQPKVGSQGSVRGFNTPNNVKVDSNRVSTDFYADFPDVSMPVTTGASTSISSIFMGLSGRKSLYHLPELLVKNNTSLFILGEVGLVLDADLNIGGDVILLPGAKLTLYIKGDLDLGGAGLLNLSGKPENLVIFGTASASDGQQIKMHGMGNMAAVIYAPNADFELKGGAGSHQAGFFGAAVAKTITINGNYDFHYDEALKDFSPDQSFQMLEWRELTASSDRYPLDKPNLLVSAN